MNRRRLLTLGAGALGLASMGVGRFSRSTWREAQGRSDRGFMSQSQGAAGSSLLNGLLGYWSLEGSSLNRVTGLTGTDTAVTYGAGKVGQGAVFNGSTSKIQTPVVGPLGAAPRSMGGWVLFATAASKNIMGYGDGLSTGHSQCALVYWSTGQLGFLTRQAIYQYGTQSAGWHHLALTYDGADAVVYIDGAAQSPVTVTLATTNADTSGPSQFGVGAAGYAPYDGPPGGADEVFLSSRAWTGAEVLTHYNAGAGRAWPL